MAKEKPATKICKQCKTEISYAAKICPQCGSKDKKPIYKRTWFIVLIVVIVIAAIGGSNGNKTNEGSGNDPAISSESGAGTQSEAPEMEQPKTPEPEITYTSYEVSELMDDLRDNAMKATAKYKDQYVELTGRLNVMDSSGKYISIVPANEEFAIIGVTCYIKSEQQKTVLMDVSVDDTLVVKGKITTVGEVMGYSLNIDEVSKCAD